MAVAVLLVMILYALLAVVFVWFVRRITMKKLYRWLAIAFVILLPTWDAVLGYMVYYPACLFVPKNAIYETAESESIYYEGIHDFVFMLERRGRDITEGELTQVGSIYYVIKRGYSFAEASVVEKYDDAHLSARTRVRITPTIYKCVPLPIDSRRPDYQRTSCSVVSEAKSRYMVKVATIKAGTAEINIKKITDRDTGKLMAEYNRAKLWPSAGILFPFFNWLDWADGSGESGSRQCPPSEEEYSEFEFKTVKPLR